ncbi:MAG: hypothetical protein JW993_18280 [Sedimentisphaerales bacterium]|nr:hypothetical protein [Sedimentisphaerales bacterium]
MLSKKRMTSKPDTSQIRDHLRHWYANIPDLYNGAFRKLWVKALLRRSMAAAIKAKCQDCVCWQNPEIRDCSVYHCSLFRYRPFAQKDGPIEREIDASVRLIAGESGPENAV